MRFVPACLLLTAACCCTPLGWAATAPDPTPSQIDDIIAKFAAKETEFSRARGNYTYRQHAKVQELDASGTPGGAWEEVADIVFTTEGKRAEHVVRAPMNSLQNILMTPEDLQDLRDVQPFVLTTSEIPHYDIRYLGREKLDELSCYTFAVKPKKLEKGKRYFEGEVWVDDQDLQIVKSYGRGVGIRKGDDQYAKFETYREQVDGKYWFPTYTIANDTLNFKAGPQKIRMTVKYQDYKQFKADTTIKYDTDEVKKDEVKKDDPKKPPEKHN